MWISYVDIQCCNVGPSPRFDVVALHFSNYRIYLQYHIKRYATIGNKNVLCAEEVYRILVQLLFWQLAQYKWRYRNIRDQHKSLLCMNIPLTTLPLLVSVSISVCVSLSLSFFSFSHKHTYFISRTLHKSTCIGS